MVQSVNKVGAMPDTESLVNLVLHDQRRAHAHGGVFRSCSKGNRSMLFCVENRKWRHSDRFSPVLLPQIRSVFSTGKGQYPLAMAALMDSTPYAMGDGQAGCSTSKHGKTRPFQTRKLDRKTMGI